jgi:hypothetical protein
MHVPVFPVVLTVQELPPPELPEGAGLGPLEGVGLESAALVGAGFAGSPLGLPGFFSSKPKHFEPIGKEADCCLTFGESVKSPKKCL